jgi:hypothetical protein
MPKEAPICGLKNGPSDNAVRIPTIAAIDSD